VSGWTQSRFWEPRYRPPAEISRAEAGELVWQALTGSVGARLGGGGDVGIVMSSGVDSSTVAAAAAATAGRSGSRLHSYSAVFPGQPHLDESDRIDSLVTSLGLRNTQVEIRPGGAFRLSLEWLQTWGIPLVDFSYPMERVLLDLAASAGVAAVLDGQYGDESFGAPVYLLADRLRHGRVLSSIRLARRLPTYERPRLEAWRTYGLIGAVPFSLEKAYSRLRPANPGYLTDESARLLAVTDCSRGWKRLDAPRWWAEKAHLLTVDRQADGISAHVRHRAALSGLSARPPLFDLDVIETLLRIPPEVEFDPLVNKVSAREAVRGRIPEELRASQWKSDLGPYILAGLAGPDLAGIRGVLAPPLELGDYVRRDAVQELMSRPPTWRDPGWRDWTVSVYKLMTVECWLRSQSDPSFARTLLEADLPTAGGTIRRTHPGRSPVEPR
jgi:asparagine synthase (glutamine-hydrolysing)